MYSGRRSRLSRICPPRTPGPSERKAEKAPESRPLRVGPRVEGALCGLPGPPVGVDESSGPGRVNVSHTVVQALPFRLKPEGLAKVPPDVPWNPKVA